MLMNPTLFASKSPSPYTPKLYSDAGEREASIWLPGVIALFPQLHAQEASSSQQDLGASLSPRANSPTSSKVLQSSKVSNQLGNLQADYKR